MHSDGLTADSLGPYFFIREQLKRNNVNALIRPALRATFPRDRGKALSGAFA